MEHKKIIVIDETIREGMQYRGMMFSLTQRIKILEFQEALGVDICQAGYPPAHDHEAATVKALFEERQNKGYRVRVGAMGRAHVRDAGILVQTGIKDFHFHIHISPEAGPNAVNAVLNDLLKPIEAVRTKAPDAVISIAMLDIGRSDPEMLGRCVSFLNRHGVDMICLPDTSGMMAPNQVFQIISRLSALAGNAALSIHCHNDLGMASANCVMGIVAGGRVLEASALGIGERNGIADLYTTARVLKDQGFKMNLMTGNPDLFREYYGYVDSLVFEQTGRHRMNADTPVFGAAARTHTAGTHAGGQYGLSEETDFYLNVLCGKGLVEKYLMHHGLICPAELLENLTQAVKSESIRLNRCLTKEDMGTLIVSLLKPGFY
jgi:isopropylmalate/homocitrate/citramalate synthase